MNQSCGTCGSGLSADDKFCGECGTENKNSISADPQDAIWWLDPFSRFAITVGAAAITDVLVYRSSIFYDLSIRNPVTLLVLFPCVLWIIVWLANEQFKKSGKALFDGHASMLVATMLCALVWVWFVQIA